jgi:hypothetical protein
VWLLRPMLRVREDRLDLLSALKRVCIMLPALLPFAGHALCAVYKGADLVDEDDCIAVRRADLVLVVVSLTVWIVFVIVGA